MAKIHDIRNQTPKRSSRRKISSIRKIARHHSATTQGDFWSFWNNRWKGLGWITGGYHEIILRDGSVQLCYDADMVTNGVLNHNSTTYHICLVGNGSFTAAQEKTFDERAKKAINRFGLSVSDVLGHKEFSGASTSCPGTDMSKVRARLRGGSTASKPSKTSKSISKMAQEIIDGKHGNGNEARRKSLGISKSEYEKVRKEVNSIVSGKKKRPTTTKTIQQMANEVKKGLHGNGHDNRRKSLGISKAKYAEVRKLVNTGIHPSSGKSISKMADEVIAGKHGSGHDNRRQSLGISQSEYKKVRAEVNRRSGVSSAPKSSGKSFAQMAQEVIDGKHGNGHDTRRKSLGINQSQYNKVRAEVNRIASGSSSSSSSKSISQMATEVIQGKHGSGHANRRKSLGISQSQYEKVRAEVNKRL